MIASIANAQAAQPAAHPPADYPLLYRNMLAVSLLGAIYQARDDVDKASRAVERTLGDPRLVHVDLAMARAVGGDAEDAAGAMARHLQQHPDDERAQIAMAMAMLLGGDTTWREVLQGLLAASTDQGVREAATGLLEAY